MPYTKEEARQKIQKLVDDFRAHEATLEHAPEAQIENNFIRPLFRYLNWNTENEGLSHAHYEFKVQATNKKGLRPDYILSLDGRDVLVMDAKQVKYSMKDPRWLYQVYSYAYSTQNSKPSEKIDFAILTDFQEFIVLDCTLFAAKPEAVNNFRVIDWKYTDYVEKFDEMWELFERNNVLEHSRCGAESDDSRRRVQSRETLQSAPSTRGLWGMYLSPQKVKANRISPDKAFLAEMDDEKTGWRVLLAKDMKKRNPAADGELITAAVQLLIDRLVFIKALSDREVDRDYLGELAQSVESSGLSEDNAGWFKACRSIFDELNNFYNGSIFAPRPELENVSVSNKVVREVINDLKPENSPYNFAVLPVEILGTIYERFLGRVVHTTDKRVTIEDKPEVRKAGGVYYTPQYIVEYIVENTVGKLLGEGVENREQRVVGGLTPADVAKIKILDPACGSGSFLLGAYSKLIEWHKDYFARAGKEKRDRELFYKDENGQIRLTAKLKRDILKNNLFGVDIDPQAVEVTRFSLSLKALEDLREGELTEERTLFHQTVLPDLSQNIKNGNSLIGMDYFAGQMFTDAAEMKRVNPFNWETEFNDVFAKGGFDAVIGNPPYVLLSPDSFDKGVLDYLNQYDVAQYKTDLFHLFIQKGIVILRNKGMSGFIIPNTWFTLQFTNKLREYVLLNTEINELVIFGHKVFQDANVNTGLIFLQKTNPEKTHAVRVKNFGIDFIPDNINDKSVLEFQQVTWLTPPDFKFEIRKHGKKGGFVSRIVNKFPALEKVARGSLGCQAYNSSKHTPEQIKNRVFHSATKISGEYLPELAGSDVARYFYERKKGQWIKYGSWLHDYRSMDWLMGPRILIREISGKPPHSICACYVEDTYCNYKTILNVSPSDKTNFSMKYLLGILNSSLISFVYPYVSNKIVSETFPRLSVRDLKQLPIRAIDFTNPAEKSQHDKMVSLVSQMLELHKSKASAKTQSEQDVYARQIHAVDEQIDRLVYELYGLNEAEIRIVEGK